ncbi:hypothetical protein QFZ54_003712 [Sphingomonas faeni]|nr:hypothetical protein [Sphingomonas faeni]
MDGRGAWRDNVFVDCLLRSVNDIEHRLTKVLPCGSAPKWDPDRILLSY